MLKLGYRPALDGIRGISVLFVLLAHIENPWLNLKGGWVGVRFFFVLSGFLITSLLLEERRETGLIALWSFYARRGLRLLPALILCVGVLCVLSAFTDQPWRSASIRMGSIASLFYMSNILMIYGKFPALELCHTWSLSIEEHFYLVWPWVVAWATRGAGRLRIRWIVLALVALGIWRFWVYNQSYDRSRVYYGTDTNIPGPLLGAALAVLFDRVKFEKRSITIVSLAGVAALLISPVLLMTCAQQRSGRLDWFVFSGGVSLVDLVGVGLICGAFYGPVQRILESRWLVWMGKVSYGLYLWHFPLLWYSRDERWNRTYLTEAIAIAATFAIVAASYYLVERPLLRRFKPRFGSTATPSTAAVPA